MHIYAIGDIHGRLGLLHAAHDRIAADQAVHGAGRTVHVGDLVDRGPDSRGVIDLLMQGITDGEDWVVLKGNHDRMFSLFLGDPPRPDPGLRGDLSWLHPRLGGADTLASYGVRSASDRPVPAVHADARAAVPADHLAFLDGLPCLHQQAGLIFAHAGIRPGVPLQAQSEDDLVWIREPFLSDRRDHGGLVVHGHTALDAPQNHGNRVNLDAGAGYGGPLTAVVIEERSVFVLTDKGRVPLLPDNG